MNLSNQSTIDLHGEDQKSHHKTLDHRPANADTISGHHSEQYGKKRIVGAAHRKIPMKGKNLKNHGSNPTFRTVQRRSRPVDEISLEVPEIKMPKLVTESGRKSYWFHPQQSLEPMMRQAEKSIDKSYLNTR